MIQWNQWKSYIFQIENIFPQKTSSTIIGTPGLILSANTPAEDDSHESFPIICDTFRERIWISDNSSMQTFPPPFPVQTTGSWYLSHKTEIAEPGCCFYLTTSVWILMYSCCHYPAGQST